MPVTLLIPPMILLTTPMKKLATAAQIVSQFLFTYPMIVMIPTIAATAIAPGPKARTIAIATAAIAAIKSGLLSNMNLKNFCKIGNTTAVPVLNASKNGVAASLIRVKNAMICGFHSITLRMNLVSSGTSLDAEVEEHALERRLEFVLGIREICRSGGSIAGHHHAQLLRLLP